MGSGGSDRTKRVKEDDEGGEEEMGKSMIVLSSSDEEANRDLSLDIVERAREREENRKNMRLKGAKSGGGFVEASLVIDLSSSEEGEIVSDRNGSEGSGEPAAKATLVVEEGREKKKKKRKNRMKEEEDKVDVIQEEVKTVDAAAIEDEPIGTADSTVTEVNDISDNIVLRKLLRGPRYFDPGSNYCESCYNCGEEGHIAVNCMMEKRKKPCFVCGKFGHNAKKCTQGQDCFICKRRGHVARDCPDKHQRIFQDSKICLRCGDMGHDMSSCKNVYAPDDLKEIQCYICKGFGHLCCVDFIDTSSREVSCYNCGQCGHTGVGCAKPRGETSAAEARTPSLCYTCGEEGHFARGCTKNAKSARWLGEPSTPTQRFSKKGKGFLGSRSLPHDFGKGNKRKSMRYEDRRNMSVGKTRIKGGWIVDDPGDLSNRKTKANGWTSPQTPAKKGYKFSSSESGTHYSNSHSYSKKRKPFPGSPNSSFAADPYGHGFSASRFSNSRHYFRS